VQNCVRDFVTCIDGAIYTVIRFRCIAIDATGIGVTRLQTIAEEPIVTNERVPRLTYACCAAIVIRAGIAVVTRVLIIRKSTPCVLVAGVVRAWVPIVTRNKVTSLAACVDARITFGAGAAVFTGQIVGGERATAIGITPVVRAEVAIVAVECTAGLTRPTVAHITHGARIAIGAGLFVVGMCATDSRVACIIGTKIPVVARDTIGECACPV
tara:strand:- start:215 stop:850 length:636 start_codon:yes stop_codon:yes gene_type:complete